MFSRNSHPRTALYVIHNREILQLHLLVRSPLPREPRVLLEGILSSYLYTVTTIKTASFLQKHYQAISHCSSPSAWMITGTLVSQLKYNLPRSVQESLSNSALPSTSSQHDNIAFITNQSGLFIPVCCLPLPPTQQQNKHQENHPSGCPTLRTLPLRNS